MKQTIVNVALYHDTMEMLAILTKHLAKGSDTIIDQLIEEEYYRVFILPTIREVQGK